MGIFQGLATTLKISKDVAVLLLMVPWINRRNLMVLARARKATQVMTV